MRMTNEQKQQIIQLYQTTDINCAELAKNFGFNRTSIRKMLINNDIKIKNHSISRQKYKINENCFDKIDSEESAYFLGLLYADGYNYVPQNKVSINLQDIDIDILHKFNKFLETDRPLFLKKSKIATRKDQYLLTIDNKHISNRLHQLGCVQRKSLILNFPDTNLVPDYLLKHFVRGYFDGDGHVGYSTKKCLRIRTSIISSESFLLILKDKIKQILNIELNIIKDKRTEKSTRMIYTKNNINSYIFLNWMYKDASVYLNRKYNIYKEIENSEIILKTLSNS